MSKKQKANKQKLGAMFHTKRDYRTKRNEWTWLAPGLKPKTVTVWGQLGKLIRELIVNISFLGFNSHIHIIYDSIKQCLYFKAMCFMDKRSSVT